MLRRLTAFYVALFTGAAESAEVEDLVKMRKLFQAFCCIILVRVMVGVGQEGCCTLLLFGVTGLEAPASYTYPRALGLQSYFLRRCLGWVPGGSSHTFGGTTGAHYTTGISSGHPTRRSR